MKLVKQSCRKCARWWFSTLTAAHRHERCPYCGYRRLHTFKGSW
jgi:DNA-directed RNA polymerase subunit RPC12/RpoP